MADYNAPWHWTVDDTQLIGADGSYILSDGEGYWSIVDHDHHKNLIAAAPDLLAALKTMLPENNVTDAHCRPDFITCENARKAIAKAEGKS